MLGLFISIFIILANILFICAIYSCIKVSVGPGAGLGSGALSEHVWVTFDPACSLSLWRPLPACLPACRLSSSQKPCRR